MHKYDENLITLNEKTQFIIKQYHKALNEGGLIRVVEKEKNSVAYKAVEGTHFDDRLIV
ncbi:hypothetical protein [Legionella sp.]|uniref:hypothetical protein n=1 Tax=Legionella sp. TaxID=459 RepID=UPI0039E72A9B